MDVCIDNTYTLCYDLGIENVTQVGWQKLAKLLDFWVAQESKFDAA